MHLDVRLAKGQTVRGRVVDDQRRGLRARVRLEALEGVRLSSDLLPAVETEATGAFSLPHVPSGHSSVAIAAPGWQPTAVRMLVEPRKTDVVELNEVTLRRGYGLRGAVIRVGGEGIPGARVRVPVVGGAKPRETRAGAGGAFELLDLSEWPAGLEIVADGFGGKTMPLGGSRSEPLVTVVLEEAALITGRVLGEDGEALEAFQVLVVLADGAPKRSTFARAKEFRVGDLPAGRCSVEIGAAGHSSWWLESLEVGVGAATDIGTVTLLRGAPVEGKVVDEDEREVSGARVSVLNEHDLHTQTGDDGTYRFEAVPLGRRDLAAEKPGYGVAKVSAMVEARDTRVNIVLLRGGQVSGKVTRRDGRGVAGFHISLAGDPTLALVGAPESAVSAEDGSFLIEHAHPGRRILLVSEVAGGAPLAAAQVEVKHDETAAVNVRLRDVRVTGTVREGGLPVEGLRLTLVPELIGEVTLPGQGESWSGVGFTDQDGHYQVVVPQSGPCVVLLGKPRERARLRDRSVILPDTDSFVLDFDLGGGTVHGTVVDATTLQPIPAANVQVLDADGKRFLGQASADGEGVFALLVPPGERLVTARADGFAPASEALTVTLGVETRLRIALEPATTLGGRLVDTSGRPVVGAPATAVASGGDGRDVAVTGLDGRFRFSHARQGASYNLMLGSEEHGFALAVAIPAGTADLSLVATQGGLARIQIRSSAPGPPEGGYATIASVDGIRVSSVLVASANPDGLVELATPPGRIQVLVGGNGLTADPVVLVAAGQTTFAEVRLDP